jgi:hypothetical protein
MLRLAQHRLLQDYTTKRLPDCTTAQPNHNDCGSKITNTLSYGLPFKRRRQPERVQTVSLLWLLSVTTESDKKYSLVLSVTTESDKKKLHDCMTIFRLVIYITSSC